MAFPFLVRDFCTVLVGSFVCRVGCHILHPLLPLHCRTMPSVHGPPISLSLITGMCQWQNGWTASMTRTGQACRSCVALAAQAAVPVAATAATAAAATALVVVAVAIAVAAAETIQRRAGVATAQQSLFLISSHSKSSSLRNGS